MADVQDETIEEPDYTITLGAPAKKLRDQFVTEYLSDYDQTNAALRVGYRGDIAKQYGIKLMHCPYVLQQIRLRQVAADDNPEDMKKVIMAGLVREANYRGPGCSQAARVAALSKLAAIHGMDAPTRSKLEMTGADGQPLNAGGIFVVPGIMTTEAWEAAAAAQQAELVAGTAPGTPDCVVNV